MPDVQIDVSLRSRGLRHAAKVLREQRDLARAARRMPRPVPWDWAAPRLFPLLAGPWVDRPGEALVRTRSELGCALVFGLDLGKVIPFVDEIVAERWERSAGQLLATGTANLRMRASRIGTDRVRGGTLSGYPFRQIEAGVRWTSSLLLVPDQLKRLFGWDDQVVVAPGLPSLFSFPADIPTQVLAGLVVELDEDETYPLLLDPFVLRDGELSWIGALETGPEEGFDESWTS